MNGRAGILVSILWFGPLLVIAGCDWPGQPRPGSRPVAADQVLSFSALYGQNCAGCHGADGRLGPAPPLNDPTFVAIVPDEELRMVIEEGRPGTPMPAFAKSAGGPLTDVQVEALAGGIKETWTSKPDPAIPPYAVSEKAGDADRGTSVFARACASCHGDDGEGSEMAGAIHNPALLGLMSDQVLRRYAITGRPDLGMPHYSSKAGRPDDYSPLTSNEINDVVALLGRWRQGRAVEGGVE